MEGKNQFEKNEQLNLEQIQPFKFVLIPRTNFDLEGDKLKLSF